MKLTKEEKWILYRLLNDHLNSLGQLTTEMDIRPELRSEDDSLVEYVERLENIEKKLNH